MYMDDIKLFAKNEKELEILIQAATIYSENIGMEFGIEKCTMLVMKMRNNRRNRTTKSRNNQNTRRKENLQILRNIGSGHHHTSGFERKN